MRTRCWRIGGDRKTFRFLQNKNGENKQLAPLLLKKNDLFGYKKEWF
jgi:hypothetical protein